MPCSPINAAGMKALEWGTGSSTQWILMRVGHLTSIEHDAGWAPAVKAAMGKAYDADFLAQVLWVVRICFVHMYHLWPRRYSYNVRHQSAGCTFTSGAAYDARQS